MDQADPSSVEIEQVTPVNKAMEQTASVSEVVEQAISVSEVIEQVVSVSEVTERATSVSEVIERVISVIEVMEQFVSEVIGQVYPPSEPDKQFALKASSLSWFSKNKNDFMIGRNDGPSRKKSKIDDDCIILEDSFGCQFDNERMIFEDGQVDTLLMYIYNRLPDTVRERSFVFTSVTFGYMIGFLRKFEEKNINQEELRMVFDTGVNFDFFKKDVIVIPIYMDLQWSIAIICYPGLIPQKPENTPYLTALCRRFLNAQEKPLKLSTNDRSSNSKKLAASARNVQQAKVPCIYLFPNRSVKDSSAIFDSIEVFLEQLWQINNKDKTPGKVLDFRTVRCLEMYLPEVDMAFERKLVHIVELFLMNPVPCTNLELFDNYFPAEVQVVAKSNAIPPPLDQTANLLFHFLYHITSKEIPDLAGWNPDTLPQWEEYLNWF